MWYSMYKHVEIRKLPGSLLGNIVNILEINEDWKDVMYKIPKNPFANEFEPKYNSEHIRLIEESSKDTEKRCAEIMLEEWSTSGRVRPTLETLQKVLLDAQIYRATDYIAKQLHEPLPEKAKFGPGAPIDTNISILLKSAQSSDKNKISPNLNQTTAKIRSAELLITASSSEIPNWDALQPELKNIDKSTKQLLSKSDRDKMPASEVNASFVSTGELPCFEALAGAPSVPLSGNDTESDTQPSLAGNTHPKHPVSATHSTNTKIDSSILHNTSLVHFDYFELIEMTNNFAKSVGAGGFGEVFVGYHSLYGLLAVKKSHNLFLPSSKRDLAIQVFNSEVKTLSEYKHKNIVPIIGYCINGPSLCIVCEYMKDGSLEEKIAKKSLTEIQRIHVIKGVAEGLRYLHCNIGSNRPNETRVHGDIKSANVLLTPDAVPKLCDFGLSKQFEHTYETSHPMGTSAYMPPEGFSGTITQKMDIYSFGIVILELLTGLRPIVEANGEQINILDYVRENCAKNDITSLLDTSISNWKWSTEIYSLARKCLQHDRNDRPDIEEVCRYLEQNISL